MGIEKAPLTKPEEPRRDPLFDPRQAQLKELVMAFFRSQGAPIQVLGDHLVEVQRIPDLADLFEGQETLRLIFDRDRARWYDDCELVAFGSPLLDRILERLTHHDGTFSEAFVEFHLGDVRPEELRPRLQFLNCEPTLELCGTQYMGLLIFRFRATFASDGKREEILRVAFNMRTGELDQPLLRTLDTLPLSPHPLGDGTITYPSGAIDFEGAFGRAREEVVRLVEQASDLEQAEATQRLAGDLAILEEYCEREIQQRRNLPSRQAEIPVFEAYAAKHRQELIDKYSLQVSIEPLSVQRIHFPTFQYRLTVPDGPQPFTVEDIFYDLHRDLIGLPPCPGCGHPVRRWYACGAGHLSCPDCTGTCHVCGQHFCTVHAAPCRICRNLVCTEHHAPCEVCGEALCPQHQQRCALDGRTVCERDSHVCQVCRQVFCDSHLQSCHLCGEAVCPEHSGACTACGHPVCPTHTVACSECAEPLCTLCAQQCLVCGVVVCAEHRISCGTCQQVMCPAHQTRCGDCGQPVCPQCVGVCGSCGVPVCQKHLERCVDGPELVCAQHQQTCRDCGGVLCPDHRLECALCGAEESYCRSHIFSCPVCHKLLCRPHSRLCPDCDGRACTEHRAPCAGCGLFMCRNCLTECDVCGHPHCQKCLHLCPDCNDGRRQCSQHLAACSTCRKVVCRTHIHTCAICGEHFCSEHIHFCQVCHEPICEEHSSPCSSCQRVRCAEHTYQCCLTAKTVGTVRRIKQWRR